MMSLFHNTNSVIAVTNDGPKGPPFIAKKGSVALALKHDAQIIAVSGTSTKYWTLPSWDKTIIPKPFSTIYIRFANPFTDKFDSTLNESVSVSQYMNNNHSALNKKVRG